VAGVVLDARAVAHFLEHLHIEVRPLLKTLGLQEFVFGLQFPEPLAQFGADVDDRSFQFSWVVT
jgi:hypothetical protein